MDFLHTERVESKSEDNESIIYGANKPHAMLSQRDLDKYPFESNLIPDYR